MEGEAMAKYLLRARYNAEGLGGVMSGGGFGAPEGSR